MSPAGVRGSSKGKLNTRRRRSRGGFLDRLATSNIGAVVPEASEAFSVSLVSLRDDVPLHVVGKVVLVGHPGDTDEPIDLSPNISGRGGCHFDGLADDGVEGRVIETQPAELGGDRGSQIGV